MKVKDVEIPLVHRDINWLSFNHRVLQEAEDKRNPLYERLKFLAIFSSNLDEYFRVRVSQLRQIKKIDKRLRKRLALRPSKQLKYILQRVSEQQEHFGTIFREDILPELYKNGIELKISGAFTDVQTDFLEPYYKAHIKPHISASEIHFTEEIDVFLDNGHLYFVLTFEDSEAVGLLLIPSKKTDRFICLPEENGKHTITLLDAVVREYASDFFSDRIISDAFEIKLSRDAELYITDEFEGTLAEKIHASLNQRLDGQPTRLLYDMRMPKVLRKKLRKFLKIGKVDMVPGGVFHNFSDFMKLPDPTDNESLHYKALPTIPHRQLEGQSDYLSVLDKEDILLHFPYMSFHYVEHWIEQAAQHPEVIAIKISLYRVADESILTNALLQALDSGKEVTVFVEAKARFDEANNLKWGKKFEDKGAKVIYSFPKIKVHSKIALVVRQQGDKKKRYGYIGTGNFNAKTSKIYCDHALLTSNKRITKDLEQVFGILEGRLIVPRTKALLISPFTTRLTFEELIRTEIKNASQGLRSGITAKLNSLEDPGIIALLYKASQAGVPVRLLVRGFSCLVPGLKGFSENIYMTSIVDRYLEHGRIYMFENNGDSKMFMGSADWMVRNLDRRIEVLTPITVSESFQELKTILDLQLQDSVKARIHTEAENNPYVAKEEDDEEVRSQYAIYDYLKQKHK